MPTTTPGPIASATSFTRAKVIYHILIKMCISFIVLQVIVCSHVKLRTVCNHTLHIKGIASHVAKTW